MQFKLTLFKGKVYINVIWSSVCSAVFHGWSFVDLSITSLLRLFLFFPRPYIFSCCCCYLPVLGPDLLLTPSLHPGHARQYPLASGLCDQCCNAITVFILLLRILCFLNEAIPTFRHQTQLLVHIEWIVKQKIPGLFEMNYSSTRSL